MHIKKLNIFLPGILFLLFIQCSNPLDKVENKTWAGKIIRTSDRKTLSDVKLKIANDTLFVFANAIFGAENDTLPIKSYSGKDSLLSLKNHSGAELKMKMDFDPHDLSGIFLIGTDFYVVCTQHEKDLFSSGELKFYHNLSVPPYAWMYLFGSYEGEIQSDNEAYNTVASFSFGSVKTKLVFYDDFKVKVIGSAMFGLMSSKEILVYHIEGDEVVIGGNSPMRFRLSNNGYTLSMIKEDSELILYKQY